MPETTEAPVRIWIAAYTGPNAEIAVRDAVKALDYPVVLPTGMVEMMHARRKMMVDRPVFPRYCFIGIPEDKSWYPLKAVTGVTGILSLNGEPQAISARNIALLREAMEEDAFTKAEPSTYQPGDTVEVMVGLTPVQAFVEAINRSLPAQRLDVMFQMFGKEHRKTFTVDKVRKAA